MLRTQFTPCFCSCLITTEVFFDKYNVRYMYKISDGSLVPYHFLIRVVLHIYFIISECSARIDTGKFTGLRSFRIRNKNIGIPIYREQVRVKKQGYFNGLNSWLFVPYYKIKPLRRFYIELQFRPLTGGTCRQALISDCISAYEEGCKDISSSFSVSLNKPKKLIEIWPGFCNRYPLITLPFKVGRTVFYLGIEFYLFVSHGGMKRQRVHV